MILFIEDELVVAEVMVELINMNGFEVTHAANINQARSIWAVHHEKIDLVLTDLHLGEEVTGLDLAEQFRLEKEIQIIVASGSHELTHEHSFHEAITVLAKPYSPTQLMKLLREKSAAPLMVT
ncbi:MAG: response regulator [Verrucomicrobiota bacterium]|nr:response regulator [Verrucomicrobiota bacterium]